MQKKKTNEVQAKITEMISKESIYSNNGWKLAYLYEVLLTLVP